MSGDTNRVFMIAEAGVNHNGSVELAHELIRAAADAGADAVKFQTFSADKLVLKDARKAGYQIANTGTDDSQYAMLKALELSAADQALLKAYADEQGVEFMSSAFDPDSVDFLAQEVGVARLKIPSGEIINGPLMLRAWRTGLPMIVSTGMCTLDEVLESLSLLAWAAENPMAAPSSREELAMLRLRENWTDALKSRVWLLQCVTQYPAPPGATNLRVMQTMAAATGLSVGLSDHSEGWHITLAAVAAGARVIEKHFTLSRSLPGPDHPASLEPGELARMIRQSRDIEASQGTGTKEPNEVEVGNRLAARGSIVAAKPISIGKIFDIHDLTVKRPGHGLSPYTIWDLIGRRAQRNYDADERIDPAEMDR